MAEQDFVKAGFSVVGKETNENQLLSFLKENYPNVIRDTEINMEELKTVLGLPFEERVNGYGLNFVGRNFARAKYAQKTEKELLLNTPLSKNIDTTENLVLKGDNLDSLKILKNYYSGKIKCIYIDPPYNTTSDEFVYPDKFDKEEAEVAGLANLSESDFARMDFSFKTKKSHNGWLAFMYPRLLLARDLLTKDGIIFISIDDNEQANLKLLCDDVFGEENFLVTITRRTKSGGGSASHHFAIENDFLLAFAKNKISLEKIFVPHEEEYAKRYAYEDKDGRYFWDTMERSYTATTPYQIEAPDGSQLKGRWFRSEERFLSDKLKGDVRFIQKADGNWSVQFKQRMPEGKKIRSIFNDIEFKSSQDDLTQLDMENVFSFPKPIYLIRYLSTGILKNGDIILDFFAGSGTTGHAVMELNKDGGSRKYILCQIDEPIDPIKKKEAYDFCIKNNLPPVISSITVERLKRAGNKIAKEIEETNSKIGMFNEDRKQIPDIGFKVFDSVSAPALQVDDKGQISLTENDTDALSRIYNMIFTVGLDEPTQVPEEVIKDCIYKIGNHYYITNSEKITRDDYSNAIKNGKVFIDGWTASLNGTLQNYKEEVKIVF